MIVSDPGQITEQELREDIRDNIHFFVDRFRINQSPFSDLDFSAARHITWDPEQSKEDLVGTGETSFDPKTALTQPGNSPAISTLSTRQTQNPDQPKTISEGVIALLWHSTFGKLVFMLFAFAAAVLAVWTTFPNSIKERLLGRVIRETPAVTESESSNSKSPSSES